MNNQELKGREEQLKGMVREDAGILSGNKTEETKGRLEQLKGKTDEEIGKIWRTAKI
jgi:uncharacterized protein YjbJ (UPF0337 family)